MIKFSVWARLWDRTKPGGLSECWQCFIGSCGLVEALQAARALRLKISNPVVVRADIGG